MVEIKCPKCDSTYFYTTLKNRVCRKCGHRWKIKKAMVAQTIAEINRDKNETNK